jgi:hypothetical protein
MKVIMIMLWSSLTLVIGAPGIYAFIIDPWITAHDAVVEQRGYERGVAYAGRKCWFRGYFMDGDQRYNCQAGEPLK